MTMAEMLIVVAIIAVLGGVAFIAVNNHQRTLGQLERDGIAKEIFVAAQNHLTMAAHEGYLGKDMVRDIWVQLLLALRRIQMIQRMQFITL